MDLNTLKQSMIDPARSKRWEFMTKKEDGSYLEDCKDDFDRYTLESMLDNTAVEARNTYGVSNAQNETSLTTGIAAFNKFAFPMVRRIYSKIVGRELVSMQPMSGPTSLIFYLDYLRNTGGVGLENRTPQGNWPTAGEAREYAHDPGEAQSGIRQINLQITSDSVTATSKKILTNWSVELSQDLMNVHGMSAQTALTGVMAQEMAREIDEQIINQLVGLAGAGTVTWNANGAGTTLPTEIAAYEKRILNAFVQANNLIFQNIYRDATFIIGGISAIERLELLESFKYVKGIDESTSLAGVKRVGTLAGRYAVYKDPWFPNANQFLMGYKGPSWLEVGYVYAPYIPYMVTEPFTNPNNFLVTKAAMSRQAYKMINANCYALIDIVSS